MKKIITIAILAMFAGMVQAEFVSLNLCKDEGFDNPTIMDGELFGSTTEGTITPRWSNNDHSGWSTTKWNDSSLGVAGRSSVGYTVSGVLGDGQHVTGGFGAPNTANISGLAVYQNTPANRLPTLTFNNINNNFDGEYAVIVYLAGHISAGPASISDGITTYYFAPPTTAYTSITDEAKVTSTVAAEYQNGSYVVFSGLTDDTFSVTMSHATNWVGIGGAQIVGTAIPEPATVGMLGLGALVTLLVRRLKRA